jgi:eukaryotic-like serine/threonine-protein kinase
MNATHYPGRRGPLLALLVIAGLLAAGCGSIANPQGWAAPVVRDEIIYVSHDAGKLGAYRAAGSARLWEFPGKDADLDLQGIYGTPDLANDTLYITGYNGSVAAVAASDGSERWRHKVGDRVIGAPLALGETVYAGTDGGALVALDRATGTERWRTTAGNQIWASPVTDGSTIFVAAMNGTVTAFNPDGSERWRTKVAGGAIAGTPALVDGVLYLGSYDKRLYAVDAATGEPRWQSGSAGNWFWTEPLIDGDTVLAGSLDGHVYAFDRQTGEERWRAAVDAPVRARLAVSNGVLVVPTGDGRLWGLRRASGEQAWQPVVVGGKLYTDLTAAPSGLYLASEVGRSSHRLYRVDAAAGSVAEIPLVK